MKYNNNIIKNRKYIQILGNFTSVEQKVYALLLYHLRREIYACKKQNIIVNDGFVLSMQLKDITKYNLDFITYDIPIKKEPIRKKNLIKALENLFTTGIKINIIRNKDYQKTKYVHLIQDLEIINNKIVNVKFPAEIVSTILELKDFSHINLEIFLNLKSKYSLKMYENLLAYNNPNNTYIHLPALTIQEFRDLIGVEKDKHKEYKYLKQFVIIPLLKELNSSTDLNIELNEIKSKRKVVKLKFKSFKKQKEVTNVLNKIEKKSEDMFVFTFLSDSFQTFFTTWIYQQKDDYVLSDGYNSFYLFQKKEKKLYLKTAGGNIQITDNKVFLKTFVNIYTHLKNQLLQDKEFLNMLQEYKYNKKQNELKEIFNEL